MNLLTSGSSPALPQTDYICEQVQNYLSCEPGSFVINVFNSWTWNISESPIESTRGLSSLVLKFTLPTTENVYEKLPWLTTTIL